MIVNRPYSDTLEACSNLPDTFCNYDFWKRKAIADGFSGEFFDLAQKRGVLEKKSHQQWLFFSNTQISGSYRYLELIAPNNLPPESLAVYENGELLGIYESYYGLWLAIYSGNEEAIDFFYSMLDITGKDIFWLPNNLTRVTPPKEGLDYLQGKREESDPFEYLDGLSEDVLLQRIEQGDGRAVMILAERGLTFNLSKSIARSGNLTFVTHVDLPENLSPEQSLEIILAAASSGNIEVLEYYERLLQISLSNVQEMPLEVILGIQKALLYHQDVQSIYRIIEKLPNYTMKYLCEFSFGLTTDLALLILEKDNSPVNYYNILLYNLGNVSLILTLFSLIDNYPRMCIDISKQENYFPLGWNVASFLDCSFSSPTRNQ